MALLMLQQKLTGISNITARKDCQPSEWSTLGGNKLSLEAGQAIDGQAKATRGQAFWDGAAGAKSYWAKNVWAKSDWVMAG